MKKIVVLMIVVVFGIALMSSCKTADCPAYSNADNIEVEQAA